MMMIAVIMTTTTATKTSKASLRKERPNPDDWLGKWKWTVEYLAPSVVW